MIHAGISIYSGEPADAFPRGYCVLLWLDLSGGVSG